MESTKSADWLQAAYDAVNGRGWDFNRPAIDTLAGLALITGSAPFDTGRGFPCRAGDWLKDLNSALHPSSGSADQCLKAVTPTAHGRFLCYAPRTGAPPPGPEYPRYRNEIEAWLVSVDLQSKAHCVACSSVMAALMSGDLPGLIGQARQQLSFSWSQEWVENAMALIRPSFIALGELACRLAPDPDHPYLKKIAAELSLLRPRPELPRTVPLTFGL